MEGQQNTSNRFTYDYFEIVRRLPPLYKIKQSLRHFHKQASSWTKQQSLNERFADYWDAELRKLSTDSTPTKDVVPGRTTQIPDRPVTDRVRECSRDSDSNQSPVILSHVHRRVQRSIGSQIPKHSKVNKDLSAILSRLDQKAADTYKVSSKNDSFESIDKLTRLPPVYHLSKIDSDLSEETDRMTSISQIVSPRTCLQQVCEEETKCDTPIRTHQTNRQSSSLDSLPRSPPDSTCVSNAWTEVDRWEQTYRNILHRLRETSGVNFTPESTEQDEIDEVLVRQDQDLSDEISKPLTKEIPQIDRTGIKTQTAIKSRKEPLVIVSKDIAKKKSNENAAPECLSPTTNNFPKLTKPVNQENSNTGFTAMRERRQSLFALHQMRMAAQKRLEDEWESAINQASAAKKLKVIFIAVKFADILLQELHKYRGLHFAQSLSRHKSLELFIRHLLTRESIPITCPLLQSALVCYPLLGTAGRTGLDQPLVIGNQLLSSQLIPSYMAHLVIGETQSMPQTGRPSTEPNGVKQLTLPGTKKGLGNRNLSPIDGFTDAFLLDRRNLKFNLTKPSALIPTGVEPLTVRIAQLRPYVMRTIQTVTENVVAKYDFKSLHSVNSHCYYNICIIFPINGLVDLSAQNQLDM
ncbi:unnamed protein product [Echinostoma caproni]|uniref:C2H2-type domain-containing protein n=1 Tax=Echinostoma caproni TaxID=27848 RepID=A0A183B0E6_9TREM|nr:unnamed protein product [Echinostoma caproni]